LNDAKAEDQFGAESPNKDLYSFGAGLRYAIGPNLSFRLDYGYPLTVKELNERHNGRFHIGALVSF
jgi:hemolysin activation/secretion protein